MSREIQPVIQQALGREWDKLHPLVRQHYDIRPGSSSELIIKGIMDEVYHSKIAKLFLLPGRLFGALVPYKGTQVPTTVINRTKHGNHKAMFWFRTLKFPNKPEVIFESRMEYDKDDSIIEYVKLGLGIKMKMSVNNGVLVFTSRSYTWNIGPLKLNIPTWLILGHATIIEKALSDDVFFINFEMTHPWFGKTFSYSGEFHIQKEPD